MTTPKPAQPATWLERLDRLLAERAELIQTLSGIVRAWDCIDENVTLNDGRMEIARALLRKLGE